MPEEKVKPSKLASIERLKQIRYDTKGPGAHRAPPARPSIDQLRNVVAKVGKKKAAKKANRRKR